MSELPIAIIGAGPVGLAAAARLHERGLSFVVLEAGAEAGHAMRAWGHVQMFSPWRYTVDPAAAALLARAGWQMPDEDSYPTGADMVDRYLAPLAALPQIAPHLRLSTRVVGVTRAGVDKLKSAGRAEAPFELHTVGPDGEERVVRARAVIDASGTYQTPSPMGASGRPAAGERALADRIFYGIPDVRGALRARYAGRRALVVGSGHSAFNAVLDLAALAQEAPGTHVTWAVRRGEMGQAYGGGAADGLPARGELGQRVEALVRSGAVTLVTGWRTDRVERTPDGLVVSAEGRSLDPVDEVVVATGLRPDLAMLGELRLALDPAVEAPAALAPLIDPNVHSCGSVPPHGAVELGHPEPGFYIVGMKSYGRAPTFLLLTGYEQVRSVAAALAGDWEAARRVELVLPETGVCSGPVAAGAAGASCCGPAPAESAAASCCAPAIAAPARGVGLIELAPAGAGLIALAPVAVAVADSAAGCCGGPAPAGADACCVQDADAKAAGQEGCGCGAAAAAAAPSGSCCG